MATVLFPNAPIDSPDGSASGGGGGGGGGNVVVTNTPLPVSGSFTATSQGIAIPTLQTLSTGTLATALSARFDTTLLSTPVTVVLAPPVGQRHYITSIHALFYGSGPAPSKSLVISEGANTLVFQSFPRIASGVMFEQAYSTPLVVTGAISFQNTFGGAGAPAFILTLTGWTA